MEFYLVGAALRMLQALGQSVPTILIGLIVAAVFRRALGTEGTFRLFGGNGRRSLVTAWLIGMLLPVCSLGVIPVAWEMRRARLSGGTILAFALTAPLFNPISVLYGLTLSDPIVILTFSFCSLLIVTVVGSTWDRIFPGQLYQDDEQAKGVPYGIRRVIASFTCVLRTASGPALGYIAVGLLGVATLSFFLPHGSLQSAAEHSDPWAPLFMTVVAIPAYATPMQAMVQLASMFEHANSVGAAFALLALGAGANLGLVAWMIGSYGWGRMAVWFSILVAIVVGLAYGVERPLFPSKIEPAGHTHAFDIYCSPFHPGEEDPLGRARAIFDKQVGDLEKLGLIVFPCVVLAGLLLRVLDRGERLERWLEKQPESKTKFDLVIPGPVLGVLTLLGLVVASVYGCFLYYPPPDQILAEIQAVNTNATAPLVQLDQSWDQAMYWIPIYEDWLRKLQVSCYLRGRELSDFHKMKIQVLQSQIELLEHEVEDQEVEESRALALKINLSKTRLLAAFADVVPTQ